MELTSIWSVFIPLVLVGVCQVTRAICPKQCICNLDDHGRRLVSCTEGGMISPIPVWQMDKNTEVIVIAAPEYSPNDLTIGPIFQQFRSLEEIHIVNSNVPLIGKHTFWGVPSIRVLNLTHNNISNVYDHNFIGMANLWELYLSDNRIDSLPSGTFRHLAELRILSLARNRLSELVPRLFLKLGKLRELDLSGNPLQELIPEVFKDVQELRALKCRSCGLRSINTQLYHLLPYLSILDFGENQFKYLMADDFRDLKRLNHLWLDGNQLPVILENTFETQTELKTLSLARNRLAKVTAAAFTNLTALESLDLSYNKLYRLDTESFHPLAENLQHLNLSGNHLAIGELKYVLQVVTKIQELSLAHMSLSDLPLGLLVYQENLRKLNFSNNNFLFFPIQVLSPVPKLAELDLTSNRFRGFDERVLIRLESIPVVHVTNNSWSCDLCHITPVINRLEKANPPKFLKHIQCNYPSSLRGRFVSTLEREDLDWCTANSYNEISGGSGSGRNGFSDLASISNTFLSEDGKLGIIAAGATTLLLLITGIVLIVGMCISKRHAANYYTNEEKRGPEHESIFENPTAILGENGEISFKFPLDISQTKNGNSGGNGVNNGSGKKVSISTIDEIKREGHHLITNGTT